MQSNQLFLKINVLFQHVKQLEAMDMHMHNWTGTDMNKGIK